jgi:hypothetical protein
VRVIAALGINDVPEPVPFTEFGELREQISVNNAFAIIGHDDHVALSHLLLNETTQMRVHAVVERLALLSIKTHNLLAMRDNPGFTGRGCGPACHHTLRIGSEGDEFLLKATTGLVSTNDSTGDNGSA